MKITLQPPINAEFDSDWFTNTTPSFKNFNDYIPEWEAKDDVTIAFLYFVCNNSTELLNNNKNIICEEAQKALLLLIKHINAPDVRDFYVPSSFNPTDKFKIVITNNIPFVHDYLYVRGSSIFKKLEFIVLNSEGIKVFETKERAVGWDGRFKGKKQATGYYNWILKAELPDGGTVDMKGEVYLYWKD